MTSDMKFDSRKNCDDLAEMIQSTFGAGNVAGSVADNPAQEKTPASSPSSGSDNIVSLKPRGPSTRDSDFIQDKATEGPTSISEEMIPIYPHGRVGSVDETCDLLVSIIQKFKAGETNVFTVIWAAIKYGADHREYGFLPSDIVGMHERHRVLLAEGVRIGEISAIENRQPHLDAIADGIESGEIEFLEVDGPSLVLVN